MTVNRRLMFGSLAIAAVVVVIVGLFAASGNGNGNETDVASDDDFTLTSSNDLSPNIGTNAVATGEAFPAVNIQTLSGDSFPTAGLVGKPLVVNFWYSTCAPCKKELPGFAAVHAKLGDQVRFVGVDTLPPSDTEEAFARDRGVQYELLYDPNGELTTAIGIATSPQTLFIDSNGTILEQTGELTAERLEELIRTTLL